jgi:mono/diheme cytochrome c family protein
MKNILKSGNIYMPFFFLLFGFILNGCDRNRNTTGWDYFPDMFYSTAYETFTGNPNFKDSMTMRVPVPGTVPRGYSPFNYTIDPESRKRAGVELVNPVSPSSGSLARGKKVYSIFCHGCHGVSGDGNGPLYESGLYPMPPRNLTDIEAINLKDGEIFHSVTLGFGSMGAHGSQIMAEDRWKLVLYIRSLQAEASGHSTFESGNNK